MAPDGMNLFYIVLCIPLSSSSIFQSFLDYFDILFNRKGSVELDYFTSNLSNCQQDITLISINLFHIYFTKNTC